MNSDRDHCSISANTENFKYEAFRLILSVLLYYSESILLIQRRLLKVVDLSRPFCPIYNLFYIVYYSVEAWLPFKVILATSTLVARVLCTSRGFPSYLEGVAMHTRVVSTSRGNHSYLGIVAMSTRVVSTSRGNRPNKEIVATMIVLTV